MLTRKPYFLDAYTNCIFGCAYIMALHMYYLVRSVWRFLSNRNGHKFFVVYEWVIGSHMSLPNGINFNAIQVRYLVSVVSRVCMGRDVASCVIQSVGSWYTPRDKHEIIFRSGSDRLYGVEVIVYRD